MHHYWHYTSPSFMNKGSNEDQVNEESEEKKKNLSDKRGQSSMKSMLIETLSLMTWKELNP